MGIGYWILDIGYWRLDSIIHLPISIIHLPISIFHLPFLSLLPEPGEGGGAPVVLAADEGPVELHGHWNVLAALEVDVVAGQGVEAGGHLRVGLDVAQGLEAGHGLGQALLGHQEVQVAHGAEADAGVEGGGEGGTLQKDDWERGRGGDTESVEDAGELAVEEEVAGRVGVVGLAQVGLDVGGDTGEIERWGDGEMGGRRRFTPAPLHPRTSAPLLLQDVVEQGGDALAPGGGGQQAPVVGTKG